MAESTPRGRHAEHAGIRTPSGAAGVRDAAGLARLRERLDCGDDLIVVSNRAPWVHQRTPHGIAAQRRRRRTASR